MESDRVSRTPAGEPHSVQVSGDGATVVFLRSDRDRSADQLWAFEVATGQERAIAGAGPGVRGYALANTTVALVVGDQLVVADLDGVARPFDVGGPVLDPWPDPTGQRVAYLVGGGLQVLDRGSNRSSLLAGEPGSPGVSWGRAEYTARTELGRDRGFWWSPDGESVLATRVDGRRVDPGRPYPLAGSATAEVTLHVLDLDGGWVDVHWDRETYPYLASVSWSEVGGPLVTVLRRLQQHGLVLAVDPRTGETQVHAELADPRWVGPVPGTPRYLADGRVLIGGELAHDGYDARCLFADGGLLTPPSLYVRRVCGEWGPDLLVEASDGEPSEQHLYRVSARSSAAAVEVARVTADAGWHRGECAGNTVAIGSSSLDRDGTEWTVLAAGATAGTLRSSASRPTFAAPRPALDRVTDRRLPAGVVYPAGHAGGRLPVLLDCGALGEQGVLARRSAWLPHQAWADEGFAVVVIDSRGTPGVAPSFEKAVHRRLADIMLADQLDGLVAVAGKHPDLDLGRVAIRGRGVGGWLAVMALLRRPDLLRCAVAIDPVIDWHQEPAAAAERYLGPPAEAGDLYGHNSLLEPAAEPIRRRDDARPLLLAGRVEPLVEALTAAARPVTLADPDDRAAQLTFLRAQLG